MKFFFEENFRFLYADGQIYDDHQEERYAFANKTLFLPEIRLYKDNENIGYVKRRFTWFLRRYDLYLHDELVAVINQKLTFLRSRMEIEELGWTINSDVLHHRYTISDSEGRKLAIVKQKLLKLTHQYDIEILDDDNEELLILLILAINQFDKDVSSTAAAGAAAANSN
ncbi:MAG: hypothetical protein IK151_04705 [Erysipelotrichaceae bacterium]|nr:hypothetical protein [Erysipelotrichaceae bacterium]